MLTKAGRCEFGGQRDCGCGAVILDDRELPGINGLTRVTCEDLSGHPYAMARLFPPSPNPHLFPDVPNRACPECIVDCDDDACTAKIDDHCTEQCRGVIVPCDDPEHRDIPCPEGKCESSTCDIPDNCSLVSTIP